MGNESSKKRSYGCQKVQCMGLLRKVIMAKYLVKVMLDFEAEFVVEADDVYQANAMAEAKAGEVYSVWNEDKEVSEPFAFITGYDPEEVE